MNEDDSIARRVLPLSSLSHENSRQAVTLRRQEISSQSIKTGARKNMQKMFKETRDILRSIDKMMEEYYDSGSQFYLGYKSVRIVKNYDIRHKPLSFQSPIPETDPKASQS